MIAEKAAESIEQAIAYELQNIVKKYGPTYASEHEAYAVLKEEIEEALDEMKACCRNSYIVWDAVKANKNPYDGIISIMKHAKALAQEAVQCAAVCERFLETIKKEEENGMA